MFFDLRLQRGELFFQAAHFKKLADVQNASDERSANKAESQKPHRQKRQGQRGLGIKGPKADVNLHAVLQGKDYSRHEEREGKDES